MVGLASQYGENTAVSSSFPADGLHAWGIFPVAVFNFTVDDFFNENQQIKVYSTSSDVGLSHFLFIT